MMLAMSPRGTLSRLPVVVIDNVVVVEHLSISSMSSRLTPGAMSMWRPSWSASTYRRAPDVGDVIATVPEREPADAEIGVAGFRYLGRRTAPESREEAALLRRSRRREVTRWLRLT